ncbi:MAG: hypothetical protein HOQ05_14310 [Corynebacteriales bacterium]|nr:hypothetical protein [Mycobacteriales bacterium]
MKAKTIRVGLYCDLGATKGAGHFVRSAALGAALATRGADVSIATNFSEVRWAQTQAEALGLRTVQAEAPSILPKLATDWDIAVIDSYEATTQDLEAMPTPLVAIDDESLRPLPAALVINQNLSGLAMNYDAWSEARVLRGPKFALLRPQFAAARPAQYRVRNWQGRAQRILLVLGGTDARAATSRLAARVLAELPHIELHVISAKGTDALEKQPVPAGSSLKATGTLPNVEEAMGWADLVISAAGTTVWELCCLGAPMALVKVAANQDLSYAKAIEAGVAFGLGDVEDAITGPRTPWHSLREHAETNRVGEAAWRLVDGLGASRVAEQIIGLAEESSREV